MSQYLEFKLGDFINQLSGGNYKDDPVALAKILENLANVAWHDVDDFCQSEIHTERQKPPASSIQAL